MEVIGIVIKDGKDDVTFWQLDRAKASKEIQQLFEKYDTDGCSVRGNVTEILNEIKDCL